MVLNSQKGFMRSLPKISLFSLFSQSYPSKDLIANPTSRIDTLSCICMAQRLVQAVRHSHMVLTIPPLRLELNRVFAPGMVRDTQHEATQVTLGMIKYITTMKGIWYFSFYMNVTPSILGSGFRLNMAVDRGVLRSAGICFGCLEGSPSHYLIVRLSPLDHMVSTWQSYA